MDDHAATHETLRAGGMPRSVNHRGPERLEAFSDGVFAIAITLLVLKIHVPGPEALADPTRLLAALAVAFNVLWYEVRRGKGVLRPNVDQCTIAAITGAPTIWFTNRS